MYIATKRKPRLQPLVVSVFALLSMWLPLSTISLASRSSVASLELQLAYLLQSTLSLAFRRLSVFDFGWHSPLLGWSLCVFPSLQVAISSMSFSEPSLLRTDMWHANFSFMRPLSWCWNRSCTAVQYLQRRRVMVVRHIVHIPP